MFPCGKLNSPLAFSGSQSFAEWEAGGSSPQPFLASGACASLLLCGTAAGASLELVGITPSILDASPACTVEVELEATVLREVVGAAPSNMAARALTWPWAVPCAPCAPAESLVRAAAGSVLGAFWGIPDLADEVVAAAEATAAGTRRAPVVECGRCPPTRPDPPGRTLDAASGAGGGSCRGAFWDSPELPDESGAAADATGVRVRRGSEIG